MSSNVKPLVALGLTAVGTALVASFNVSDPSLVTAAVPISTTKTTAPTTSAASSSTSRTTTGSTTGTTATTRATPAPAVPTASSVPTTAASAYADGTYSGSAVREPWGTFQIQVAISGGEITAVNLVSSPNDRHSGSINSYAVPRLTQQVLADQSTNIDWISGATWTSQSYETSLQSALDDAAAARAGG